MNAETDFDPLRGRNLGPDKWQTVNRWGRRDGAADLYSNDNIREIKR